MPVECAVFGKATATLEALERLLPGVVADVARQRALLPEATRTVGAHVGLVLPMSPLVNLQGILGWGQRQEGADVNEVAM